MQATLNNYDTLCTCCGHEVKVNQNDYCTRCIHRGCHIDDPYYERECWTAAYFGSAVTVQ